MVRRAVLPAVIAFPIALLLGWTIGGPGVGISAALGIAVVFANFAVHGWSLAWASTISIPAVHAVSLLGPVARIAAVVGLMFVLERLTTWFSPLAFGLAVVPGTLLLLVYEARLTIRGVGAALQIPADPAAERAREALAAQEANRW